MIVVVGVVNVEVSVPVPGFPLAYEPVCYPEGEVVERVGGVGFNVAAGLAALGAEVRLATIVGTDALGVLVEQQVRARGLWGPAVLREGQTPRSVVLYGPDGRRMVNTDLRGTPDAVYPLTLFAEQVAGAEMAVVTNIGFARPLLPIAQQAGVPIAADVQAIASIDDAYNQDWLAAASIVFCSHERLPCSPESWVRDVWDRYGTPIVVVGCGAHGAVLGVRESRAIRAVPACAPRGVVNTVGAGDALLAAFVHAYAAGDDPESAISRAVWAAGWKVGAPSFDPTGGFATEAEVRAR